MKCQKKTKISCRLVLLTVILVLHLFAENKFVNEHNDKILNQMSVEKVVMPCHNSVVSANIPPKECQKLINSLPVDCSKTCNLMK